MSPRPIVTAALGLALLALPSCATGDPQPPERDQAVLDTQPTPDEGLADPPQAKPTADASELMQADREFAADAAARRLEGWMHWFTDDAVKAAPTGEPLRGAAAIRAADAAIWDDPSLLLSWEPNLAGWLEPGRTGYTRGRYELTQRGPDGVQVVGTGTYFTLWLHTADGWRVPFDTGVPDT